MPFVGGSHTCITNPRWRTAAILKKSKNRFKKSLYLGRGFIDFDEIWHDDEIRHLRCVPQLEICNF